MSQYLSQMPLQQKSAIFRSVSATIYLCDTLRFVVFAWKGFPSPNLFGLILGLILAFASITMMLVNIGKPPNLMGHIERIKFPAIPQVMGQGESFFTFNGRVLVDILLGFCLLIFVGGYVLGILTLLMTGAAFYLKKHQTDLFNELFHDSDGGAYTSVDSSDIPHKFAYKEKRLPGFKKVFWHGAIIRTIECR
eukprot:scaffold24_cov128-Cylindrotheca_fusiformis.AAC.25